MLGDFITIAETAPPATEKLFQEMLKKAVGKVADVLVAPHHDGAELINKTVDGPVAPHQDEREGWNLPARRATPQPTPTIELADKGVHFPGPPETRNPFKLEGSCRPGLFQSKDDAGCECSLGSCYDKDNKMDDPWMLKRLARLLPV